MRKRRAAGENRGRLRTMPSRHSRCGADPACPLSERCRRHPRFFAVLDLLLLLDQAKSTRGENPLIPAHRFTPSGITVFTLQLATRRCIPCNLWHQRVARTEASAAFAPQILRLPILTSESSGLPPQDDETESLIFHFRLPPAAAAVERSNRRRSVKKRRRAKNLRNNSYLCTLCLTKLLLRQCQK